jgi:polyhydroxybutyrate depolymerase
VALATLLVLLAARVVHAAPEELSLDTQDGQRTAMLALPPDSPPEEAIPLVVLLHGRGGSAQGSIGMRHSLAAPLSAWVPIGARDRVAVLALQGTRGSSLLAGWDDCRADDPSKPGADDVAYANRVIEMVMDKHAIDRQRVYLMGMSNGDPLVPYEGGAVHFGTAELGTLLSVDDTLAMWRRLDGIDAAPKVDRFARRPDSDGHTFATRTVWGDDPRGLQVELIRIDGGGHTEPSIDQVYGRIYLGLAGAQNHDLESAEEAWRFFRDKRSPDAGRPAGAIR